MPVTPFHVFPAIDLYFLLYRRLNGVAFFLGNLLIDLEPFLYVFFGVGFPQVPLLLGGFARQGFHMITHNPFSIILLVAPVMVLLTKLVEVAGHGVLVWFFPDAEWIRYSLIETYLSAILGAFLHLGLDLTMHRDVNLGFPFVDIPNSFINLQASNLILPISLIVIPVAYVLGRRINTGSPFKKLP